MRNAEYLVVLEVLSHARGRDRERMYRALRTHSAAEIDAAIASLEQAGVVLARGTRIHPTSALSRLENLNLIGI
jgi:hypothetical protein